MEKPTYINIHVESMTRCDKLDMEFVLPYCKELEDAVIVINNHCSRLVYRRKEQAQDEFLAKKAVEIINSLNSNLKRKISIKSILEDIIKYGEAI